MEILSMAMDFFIGFVFLTIVIACGWGSVLFVMDEQADWEARRDYEEMQKSIKNGKENESSRTG